MAIIALVIFVILLICEVVCAERYLVKKIGKKNGRRSVIISFIVNETVSVIVCYASRNAITLESTDVGWYDMFVLSAIFFFVFLTVFLIVLVLGILINTQRRFKRWRNNKSRR